MIAADASVLVLADVSKRVGRFNVMNIKRDKCGGLTEALRMADLDGPIFPSNDRPTPVSYENGMITCPPTCGAHRRCRYDGR